MILHMYDLILTLMLGVTFSSGRTLVIKSNSLDNHLNGLEIIPIDQIHISEVKVPLTNSNDKYTLSRVEPIRSHSSHSWRHRDRHAQRSPPSYRSLTKDHVDISASGQGNKVTGQHSKSQGVAAARKDEMHIINNKKADPVHWSSKDVQKETHVFTNDRDDNVRLSDNGVYKTTASTTKSSRKQVKFGGSKRLWNANQMNHVLVPGGNANVSGNDPKLPSPHHQGAERGKPSGRYKQGHLHGDVEIETQPNGLYEGNQRHKADTLGEVPTSANIKGINQVDSTGKEVNGDAVFSSDSSDNNAIVQSYGPSLDIPDRFFKIPSSEQKLQSLIQEVLLSHPCIKQVSGDNSVKLSLNRESGSEDFRDNVIKAGKRIKLCRQKQGGLGAGKKPGDRGGRHKRRHNKTARHLHGKSHFDGTISQGKQLSLVNGTDKGQRIQLQPRRIKLNATRTNGVITSEGRETSSKEGNLIRVSSPLLKEAAASKQQIASGERKEHISHTHQFSTAGPMTNSTWGQDDAAGKGGGDFIITCSEQTGENVWTRARINGLLNEVVEPRCWHAAALQEIYQLEGELHGKKSNEDSKGDTYSVDSLKGVSEVICYLIEETNKCLSSVSDLDSSGSNSYLATKENSKSPSTTSTGTTITTTQKMVTSSKSERSKVNTKAKEYPLTDKLNGFDQANYFNLDWEANMLFY